MFKSKLKIKNFKKMFCFFNFIYASYGLVCQNNHNEHKCIINIIIIIEQWCWIVVLQLF